jgi:hypothetical protein
MKSVVLNLLVCVVLSVAAGTNDARAGTSHVNAANRLTNVACATNAGAMSWGSYHVRCNQLAFLMAKFGHGDVTIRTVSLKQISTEPVHYDATILIKMLAPPDKLGQWHHKLGRQFLDLVDDQNFKPTNVPKSIKIIAQNANVRGVWSSTHQTYIIEHSPSLLNYTGWSSAHQTHTAEHSPSLLNYTGFFPAPVIDRPLRAATVMESRLNKPHKDECFKVKPSAAFDYACLTGHQGLRQDLFTKALGISNATAYARTVWGTGWLYNRLFQSYDTIVVYVKQGWKFEFGAVQRMTNAMTSGVVTAVERVGVHLLYVPSSYQCSFTTPDTLRELLVRLASDSQLRSTCRTQAAEILNHHNLTADAIVRKYEQMLRVTDPPLGTAAAITAAAMPTVAHAANIYHFIHPTKSGGTALENFFLAHYKDHIEGRAHKARAADYPHPIIVVRDPYDRASSMFLYWKHGSSKYKRTGGFRAKWKHLTLEQYLFKVKREDSDLTETFTKEAHHAPTASWIGPESYSKSIVIEYATDMNYCISALLSHTGIPNKGAKLPVVNPSLGELDIKEWTPAAKQLVEEIFVDDFKLIQLMRTEAGKFAFVIRPTKDT